MAGVLGKHSKHTGATTLNNGSRRCDLGLTVTNSQNLHIIGKLRQKGRIRSMMMSRRVDFFVLTVWFCLVHRSKQQHGP